MPCPLVKVTLAGLLLLGAATFLQAQEPDDIPPEKFEELRKWSIDEIAKLKARASEQNIDASALVVPLDKYISKRIKREYKAAVKSTCEKNHKRLWVEYLKSLGYLSPKETLNREATPIVKMTSSKIREASITLETLAEKLKEFFESAQLEVDPSESDQFEIKLVSGDFYEYYQTDVLLTGKVPSLTSIWPLKVSPEVKLRNVEQMVNLLCMLTWTLQLKAEEEAKAAQEEADQATYETLWFMDEQMSKLQSDFEKYGIAPERYLFVLQSYLPWYREKHPGSWPDAKGMQKYWVPFLKAIDAFRGDGTPQKQSQFYRIYWRNWWDIKSEELDRAAGYGTTNYTAKNKYYDVNRIAEYFFDKYYQDVVEKKGVLPTDPAWLIQRQAEFITLMRWALEDIWNKKPRGRFPYLQRKTGWEQFERNHRKTAKYAKGALAVGGVIGAGLAARYGLPPLWNALFGGDGDKEAEVTSSEAPQEEEIVYEEEKPSVAEPEKPEKPEKAEEKAKEEKEVEEVEEPEVYEEPEDDAEGGGAWWSGSKAWIYLLVALAVLLLINVNLLCCSYACSRCRARSGSGSSRSSGTSQSENASGESAATLSLNASHSGDAPLAPPPLVWPTYSNPHPESTYSTPKPEPIYDDPQPYAYSSPVTETSIPEQSADNTAPLPPPPQHGN